jgi:hypothetical protein
MALERPTRRARAQKGGEPARDPRVMGDHEVPDDLETATLSYEDAVRYLRRQKLVCRGPITKEGRELVNFALSRGNREVARKHDAASRGVRNRSTGELEPCGYDFVDMIVDTKHPCPKCGVEGELQPAYLNVSDRPSAKAHATLHEKFLTKAKAAHESRTRAAASGATASGRS